MKRSTAIFVIATSVLLTVAYAGPASARPRRVRTQTVTATYSGAGYAWADVNGGGLFVDLGTSEAHFDVPRWAPSARTSVEDATGLPVQFGTELDNGGWRSNCAAPAAINLSGRGAMDLAVVLAAGVWNGCALPVSMPTNGNITVTFSG